MKKDRGLALINWNYLGPLMLAIVVWANWNHGLSGLSMPFWAYVAQADNALADLAQPPSPTRVAGKQ